MTPRARGDRWRAGVVRLWLVVAVGFFCWQCGRSYGQREQVSTLTLRVQRVDLSREDSVACLPWQDFEALPVLREAADDE